MTHFFRDFFKSRTKISLALVVLPLLLYRKVLFYDFSPMDEQWLIEDNFSFLGKWANLKTVFKEPTAFVFYRPLFMVSLILDYHIGKLSPFYYHFSNLIFHLVNVLLLFRLLLIYNTKEKAAFCFALLFAVHPVLLHAVAWIPGRNDSLLCIFVLSALIFLNKYISENKVADLGWHFLFFILALFTKESAIVLPFVFILIYSFQNRKENKKVILFSALWLIVGAAWFALRSNVVIYFPSLETNGLTAVKEMFFALLIYIGKTIFPIQQSVFPTLKNSSVLPGIITLAVFIFLGLKFPLKNKPVALLGVFLFFAFLILPIWFGILKSPGEHYEHRIYTSMAGLFLFLSQIDFKWNSKTLTAIFILLLVTLSAKTFIRMDVYKDKMSFLDAGIHESPGYYYFHLTKGDLLYKEKKYVAALESFNKAIELNPSRPQSYNNRANAHVALGQNKEAIADYSKALDKTGTNATVLMQRCIAYYTMNDLEHAMQDLDTLKKCCQSQIHPDMEKTLTEKWEVEKWQKKINADPKNAALYIERAKFFMEKRMGKEALADLQKACELDPTNKTYKAYLLDLSNSFPH